MRIHLPLMIFLTIFTMDFAHAKKRDRPLPVNLTKMSHTALQAGEGVGVFYVGVGITTAAKCLSTHDPIYCREYIYSFKDVSNYGGLGVFIGGSSLLQSAVKKVPFSGAPVVKALAGEYIGMAGGTFLNSAFNDIYHLPESKQLVDSFKEGEKTDWVQRQKLIDSLMRQTLSNREWWENRGPELISLVGSAMASQATSMALNSSIARWYSHQDSRSIGCAQSDLLRKVLTGVGLEGTAKFARNSAVELSKFVSFIAWQNAAIEPLVDRVWDLRVEQTKIQNERKRLADVHGTGSALSGQTLSQSLAQNDRAWTKHRQYQLKNADSVMSTHLQDLNEFDRNINKTHAYYNWLKNGAKDDASWSLLRDTYYTPKTRPIDLKSETHRYLNAFFNGPPPEHAFQDRLDIHGLPIPSRMKESVTPYRASGESLKAQLGSDEDLLKEISSPKFEFANDRAFSVLMQTAGAARKKRIDFYEEQVQGKLLGILEKPGIDGTLGSMQVQVDDLEKLKMTLTSTHDLDLIDLKIGQIRSQMKAVQALISYYELQPKDRVTPDETIQISDEDWALCMRYYQSYIFK